MTLGLALRRAGFRYGLKQSPLQVVALLLQGTLLVRGPRRRPSVGMARHVRILTFTTLPSHTLLCCIYPGYQLIERFVSLNISSIPCFCFDSKLSNQ